MNRIVHAKSVLIETNVKTKMMKMIKKIIEYIDSMWISEQIWYRMNWKGNESRNVSRFLKEQLDSGMLDSIIHENGWHDIANEERMVYMVFKWVLDNFEYKKDIYTYKTHEYWASVDETITKGEGDCEDLAVLMFAILRKLGIPRSRVKLWAGNTKYGGHACMIYKSEQYPYVWFFMDWCMEVIRRVPGKTRKAYMFKDKLSIVPYNSPYKDGWFVADDNNGARRLR